MNEEELRLVRNEAGKDLSRRFRAAVHEAVADHGSGFPYPTADTLCRLFKLVEKYAAYDKQYQAMMVQRVRNDRKAEES